MRRFSWLHLFSLTQQPQGLNTSTNRTHLPSLPSTPTERALPYQGSHQLRMEILVTYLCELVTQPTPTMTYNFTSVGKYVLNSQQQFTDAFLDHSLFKLRAANICRFLINTQIVYTFYGHTMELNLFPNLDQSFHNSL